MHNKCALKRFDFMAVFMLLFLMLAGQVHSEEKRIMIIRRTTGPIYIDGNLTEKDWINAETVGELIFPWWEKGDKEMTIPKLLWDDEYLYVSFFCHDKWISAELTQRNSPVSRDDCVEVFICPDTSRVRQYMNFEINAIATLLCRINPLKGPRPTWEPPQVQIGRSHKGTINDNSDEDEWWIIELAIPFKSFTIFEISQAPKGGDAWNINLYRIGGKTNPQYSVFNDLGGERPNYHTPERFGRAIFSNDTWPYK